MTRKWFFEFLTPKNYLWAFTNHRNVFYSSQGTRLTLKFCSSSIRSKVIGDHGFRHFSALDLTSEVTGWPRTLSLYIHLFVSRRATRSFFPRSSSSIRGETARGGRTNPPTPLCRGRMRNGLCRRGLRNASFLNHPLSSWPMDLSSATLFILDFAYTCQHWMLISSHTTPRTLMALPVSVDIPGKTPNISCCIVHFTLTKGRISLTLSLLLFITLRLYLQKKKHLEILLEGQGIDQLQVEKKFRFIF